MVKVADLGYKDSNLQDIASKQDKKRNKVDAAISNLAATAPPEKLLPPLPRKLFEGSKDT